MAKAAASRQQPKRAAVFEQDSEDSDAGSLQLESGSELGSDLEQDDQQDSEEEEEERPKYAQFMDDSDLDEASDDESLEDSEGSDDDAAHAHSSDEATSAEDDDEDDLQQQMKEIPFSALIKARQQMDGSASDDDLSEPDISDLEEDEFAHDRKRLTQAKAGKQPQRNGHAKSSSKNLDADEALEKKRREVRERLRQLNGSSSSSTPDASDNAWAEARKQREQRRSEERKELVKRSNKNAPTEVSSKRPVSRRRNVIETGSAQVRDPRFESLSGSVNRDLFAKSYSFLPDMFKDELSTLKKTLAKLKKQESAQAGPKAKSEQALAIREERAKVEAALRRAEGLAGERERRARESSVKGKIKAQNKERVEKGLQPFYPKKSEVKQMLLKDKYDRLAGGADGEGRRASGQEKKQLKKALERRRRKNAQKEKRDMPAGIGFARDGAAVPKRKRMEGGSSGDSGKRSKY